MKATTKNFMKLAVLGSLLSGMMSGQAVASEADEVRMMEKIRTEQSQYFKNLQRDIDDGRPVDISTGKCTYISSLFQPPPLKVVALTFDDGPSSTLTPIVLDTLKKYNIKGTFFMKGDNAKANPKIVARVRDEGHIVANHSFTHPNFHTLTTAKQTSQVTTTDSVLEENMNGFRLFRYPFGNSTCATNALVKQLGYTGIVGWHVDTCDWAYAASGAVTAKQASICEVAASNKANFVGHVMASVEKHKGGIILMHEIHSRTVKSLEEMIVKLLGKGYKFTNLDDPKMAPYLQ